MLSIGIQALFCLFMRETLSQMTGIIAVPLIAVGSFPKFHRHPEDLWRSATEYPGFHSAKHVSPRGFFYFRETLSTEWGEVDGLWSEERNRDWDGGMGGPWRGPPMGPPPMGPPPFSPPFPPPPPPPPSFTCPSQSPTTQPGQSGSTGQQATTGQGTTGQGTTGQGTTGQGTTGQGGQSQQSQTGSGPGGANQSFGAVTAGGTGVLGGGTGVGSLPSGTASSQ